MTDRNVKQKSTLNLFLSLVLVSLFSGCGKHEATGGALGATSGSLIGNAVAGRNNKAAGTIIGGLIGGVVGSSIGREADEEEEIKTKIKRHQMEHLQKENAKLRRNLEKWCSGCGRKSDIMGAFSCARCGSKLIQEKYCTGCKTVFSPKLGYKYCPYCEDQVLLRYR